MQAAPLIICACLPYMRVCLQTGEICLDILKNAWSPAWTLHSVCQAILALMSDPAPDSPLNCDAGELGYCPLHHARRHVAGLAFALHALHVAWQAWQQHAVGSPCDWLTGGQPRSGCPGQQHGQQHGAAAH